MKKYNTIKRLFVEEIVKFRKNINDYEMLPHIKNTKITDIYEDDSYIGLDITSVTTEGACNHCGQVIHRNKGYVEGVTTHGMLYDKILLIRLRSKRYYCTDCKKATTEKLLTKGTHRVLTMKSIEAMINLLKVEINENYSTVARKFRVTRMTVINIFDRYVKNDSIDVEKVTSICIDENRILVDKKKGFSYQLIAQDSNTGAILDVVESRKKQNVLNVLSKYPNVKTLSIDFWSTYKNCGLQVNPDMKIIPDNFHAVRNMTWAFDRTRSAVLKALDKSKSKNWRLYNKTYSKLNEKGKERIGKLLRENKELIPAYLAKEVAFKMFNRDNTVERYYELLKELKRIVEKYNLDEFQKAIRLLEEWDEHIVNIFKYKDHSNGLLERLNSSIKYIKRSGRGYKNVTRLEKLIKLKLNKNSAA